MIISEEAVKVIYGKMYQLMTVKHFLSAILMWSKRGLSEHTHINQKL